MGSWTVFYPTTEITHYGVKGMKWGVRKEYELKGRTKSNSSRESDYDSWSDKKKTLVNAYSAIRYYKRLYEKDKGFKIFLEKHNDRDKINSIFDAFDKLSMEIYKRENSYDDATQKEMDAIQSLYTTLDKAYNNYLAEEEIKLEEAAKEMTEEEKEAAEAYFEMLKKVKSLPALPNGAKMEILDGLEVRSTLEPPKSSENLAYRYTDPTGVRRVFSPSEYDALVKKIEEDQGRLFDYRKTTKVNAEQNAQYVLRSESRANASNLKPVKVKKGKKVDTGGPVGQGVTVAGPGKKDVPVEKLVSQILNDIEFNKRRDRYE